MHSIRSLIVILSVGLVACVESSAPPPPVTKPEDALMRALSFPETMILAETDTGRIRLSAINVFGDTVLPSENAVIKWTSSDVATATVDTNGVVTARRTAGNEKISITAKWSQDGVTKSAVTSVYVTATRLPIDHIDFVSRDSTRTSASELGKGPGNWAVVIARNVNGDSLLAPLPIVTTAPSSKVASLGVLVYPLGSLAFLLGGTGPYAIISRHIGDYWLYAEAMVYGTMMRDSLKFTGLYVPATTIQIARDSLAGALVSPRAGVELVVQPCGSVNFQNQSQIPIDIVFDDSTKTGQCVPSDQIGNIANILPGGTATRKFPAVGTVQWTVRDRNTGQLTPTASGKVSMRVP